MRQLLISTLIIATALLSACSRGPLSVHKIDIQQGNAVTEESIAQLRVGMNARQVLFIMGNPMLTDPFHAERWDYVYYMKPGKGDPQQRRVTLFFEEDRVVRIEKVESGEG